MDALKRTQDITSAKKAYLTNPNRLHFLAKRYVAFKTIELH